MLTVIDSLGLLHLIPRERLVSISMLRPDPPGMAVNHLGQQVPVGDPPGTKMKLLISYETTTPSLGQLLFLYTDEAAIVQLKTALRQWAAADAANQLVINAGTPPPATPESTAAIGI